jgi:hypothetical protein
LQIQQLASQLSYKHVLIVCASAAGEPALDAAWCTSTSCAEGSSLQQSSGTQASATTPAVFRRLSQANLAATKLPGAPSDAQQMALLHCQKLEAELQLWKVSLLLRRVHVCKLARALQDSRSSDDVFQANSSLHTDMGQQLCSV